MTMMNGQIQMEHQYLMIFGKIIHCIGKLVPEFNFLAVKYGPFVYNLTIVYTAIFMQPLKRDRMSLPIKSLPKTTIHSNTLCFID